jgi:hypothetical protein
VSEALLLPWSNDMVKGQIHRLKLIKRQMYGRPSFDLLNYAFFSRHDFQKLGKMIPVPQTVTSPKVSQNPNNSESYT